MKNLRHLLCLCALVISFVLCSVDVHAEEYSDFVFANYYYTVDGTNASEFKTVSAKNIGIVTYLDDVYHPNENYVSYIIYCIDTNETVECYLRSDTVYTGNTEWSKYDEYNWNTFTQIDKTVNGNAYTYYQVGSGGIGYYDIEKNGVYHTCDIEVPFYSSYEYALNGIVNGSTEGLLNGEIVEISKDKHNFKSDTIDTTIPLPVISNVSHEGFTIDNIEGTEYFVDVLVENRLFGVKHYKKPDVSNTVDLDVFSSSWDCLPDTSWEYATDYFNICASTDVAINHSVINLEDDYSVDNVGSLLSHYAQWSIDYPKRKNLPDYNWTMLSALADSLYESKHTLQAVSDISSEQQLYNSGQASTSYYVRFYTKDNRTGQWVRYTYRDGYGTVYNGMIEDGTISSGVVDISPDGNVVVKDEVNGNVSEDGSIYYPVTETPETNFDTSLNGFMDTLSGFSGVLGMFGGFMSSMFGWLPWWCSALIGAALVAVVVLRFLGR